MLVYILDWTFEEKGTKRIEIADLDDKRQITVLLSCSMKVIANSLIYEGKTPACLPKVASPKDCMVLLLYRKSLVE